MISAKRSALTALKGAMASTLARVQLVGSSSLRPVPWQFGHLPVPAHLSHRPPLLVPLHSEQAPLPPRGAFVPFMLHPNLLLSNAKAMSLGAEGVYSPVPPSCDPGFELIIL
jgi:hypothetical protein